MQLSLFNFNKKASLSIFSEILVKSSVMNRNKKIPTKPLRLYIIIEKWTIIEKCFKK